MHADNLKQDGREVRRGQAPSVAPALDRETCSAFQRQASRRPGDGVCACVCVCVVGVSLCVVMTVVTMVGVCMLQVLGRYVSSLGTHLRAVAEPNKIAFWIHFLQWSRDAGGGGLCVKGVCVCVYGGKQMRGWSFLVCVHVRMYVCVCVRACVGGCLCKCACAWWCVSTNAIADEIVKLFLSHPVVSL